jgi:hypothetical protein
MKAILAFLMVPISVVNVIAQGDPVSWSFSAKKIAEKTYEVHFIATIQSGWHLYSQVQPDDAIAIPTNFAINGNPLLNLEGKIKEDGKMEKFHDEKLEVSAHQYSGKVGFIQIVQLKAKVKTNLTGSVEYQTCDDIKCLPPKTVTFSVPIN